MEAIFTLPYSEYATINELQKKFKKPEFSFYVPTSRQEKGVDFIMYNNKTNKCLKFQVKSSKSYNGKNHQYGLWFPNFLDKFDKSGADYYILFSLYPFDKAENLKSFRWKPLVMCFSKEEMFSYLSKSKTKKENKPERFLRLEFDPEDEVYTFKTNIHLPDCAMKNKIEEIKDKLR